VLGALPWSISSSATGGEKQRPAVGRALASFSPYLLMDKLLSHFDERLKEELQQLLLSLSQEVRIGTIYVTHNVSETPTVARRVAPTKQGLLVWIDDTEEFLRNLSADTDNHR
jgi:ABC-type molybdate transport system ATPase subunit